MHRVVLSALVLIVVGLSGCSSSAPFPGAYLPSQAAIGPDYSLTPEDCELWQEIKDDIGATRNPGPIDPQRIAEEFEMPQPTAAHLAVFSKTCEFQDGFVYGFAMVFGDVPAFQAWLDNMDEDWCDEASVLVRGNRLAMVGGFGDSSAVLAAKQNVLTRTGAVDWCEQLFAAEPVNVMELAMGENGPFSFEDGESHWFRFQHSGGALDLETHGVEGDSVMALYDPSLLEVADDDDGGDETWSRIRGDYPAGTYHVEVMGYDGSSLGEYFLRRG